MEDEREKQGRNPEGITFYISRGLKKRKGGGERRTRSCDNEERGNQIGRKRRVPGAYEQGRKDISACWKGVGVTEEKMYQFLPQRKAPRGEELTF